MFPHLLVFPTPATAGAKFLSIEFATFSTQIRSTVITHYTNNSKGQATPMSDENSYQKWKEFGMKK